MKNKNHNIRFNMEKGDECRAWELLHSPQIRQMFKSQNKFVIEAVNDYYDRYMAAKADPYMETREKEDAFPAEKTAAVDCPDTGIVRKKPPCGGCSQGNGGGLSAKGKEKIFIEKKFIYRNGKAS